MSWFTRLRNAIQPHHLDHDLEEELRDHLERRTAALAASGLPPGEAQQAAQRRFGNVTRLREESREARLSQWLENTFQDARYALRLMRKQPAFTTTIVVSLGLAIGANTAVFSLLDAAMLRPLPVTAPAQLIALSSPGIQEPGADPVEERQSFSYPQFRFFREAAHGAADLELFSYAGPAEVQQLEADSPVEAVMRQHVSGNAFAMLGVTPALGRLIGPDDDGAPGAHPVVVLGYQYWHNRFHAEPGVLGKQLIVGGMRCTIIGVAREGFFGVEPGKIIAIWRPAMEYDREAFENASWSWFRILGRLNPAASKEQVKARLQPAFHQFNEATAKRFGTMPPAIRQQFLDAQIRVQAAPTGMSSFRQAYRLPLLIILGVVLAILAIACANVASLLLARATARASEVALRISLGAGRGRLIRQLLTESVLYAVTAGVLGWLLARAVAPLMTQALSTTTDQVEFVLPMNTKVLLFSILVSLAAAVIFGLVPAWQASRSQPIQIMRAASGQSARQRLGRFFVTVQVAFAFALVMLGAAFLFSLRNLTSVKMGFRPHGLTAFNIQTSDKKLTDETKLEVMEQLRARISTLPGVTSTAAARWAIFSGAAWTEQIIISGKTPSEREELLYPVSPGYFSTLGGTLLAGRDFERPDFVRKDQTPAIVNLAFAAKYFPGIDPLGQHFTTPAAKIASVIVGVAANANYADLRHGAEPLAYMPFTWEDSLTIYVRSRAPLGLAAVDREVRAVRPGLRVIHALPLETLVSDTILRERLLAVTGAALGLLGLLLAAIGLFGLLNYSVERRTREIGIRAALGAQVSQIVGLVVRETLALVAIGVATGLLAAVFILASLDKLLFGIHAADPLVALTACGLFLLAALLAAGLPARRAAAVDPLTALRSE